MTFDTACCPSNLARLLPQVAGMQYAYRDGAIHIALYIGSRTTIPLPDGAVGEVETGYPFDGRVAVHVQIAQPQRFALRLRVPTWSRGERFVPGELYAYATPGAADAVVTVNDAHVPTDTETGWATVERVWQPGDIVTLELAMPPRLNVADPRIEADRGRVALTRGPLVYCAEAVDNGPVRAARLDRTAPLTLFTIHGGPLDGLPAIDTADKATGERLRFIPYYAWNNRGDGEMAVWLSAD